MPGRDAPLIDEIRSTLGEIAILAAKTEATERAILEAAERRLSLLLKQQEGRCDDAGDEAAAEILALRKVIKRACRALA